MSLLTLIIIISCFCVSIGIGVYFSRRQTGMKSFFLGGSRMSGWPVGFSITASMISAMTFLSNPGYSFQQDFRWVLPGFCFVIIAIFAMFFVVPYFRRVNTASGYQFLEQRFGTWARIYAAGGFLIFKLLRIAIILYATSLALEIFLGIPAPWIILAMGIATTIYTMAGGFEAVIWTEFFQVIILMVGAFLLVPAVVHCIPGGLSTVFETALPAGKFSLGNTHFSLTEKTLWVMILSSLFVNASDYTTRQDFIQRFRAPRSLGQARLALTIGAVTVVPIWIYFNFLGTSLWVLYQKFPDPQVAAFTATAPEKVVPYFMSTRLPPWASGIVLAGILMSALSTVAPILNAAAVTWTSDFHQRLIAPGRDDRYYLRVGRLATVASGMIAILMAIYVSSARTQTLQDLYYTISVVLSAGLFGLFMLGFFSRGTSNRHALFATVCTAVVTVTWLFLCSDTATSRWPGLTQNVPDLFWVPVFSNLMLPALALLYQFISRRRTGLRHST